MAYFNFKLAKEKNISPRDVLFLQMVHQNTSGDMESLIGETIDENDLACYVQADLVTFIKGKKKDSDLFKLRLSKKGKKVYSDILSYKTVETDFQVYEFLKDVYKELDKAMGGSRNKITGLIAAFRSESGLSHRVIYKLVKHFVNNSENMEYNHNLAYLFFKPENAFSKFKLEDSRLWQYYLKITEND